MLRARKNRKVLSAVLGIIFILSIIAPVVLAEDSTPATTAFSVQGNTNIEKAASIVSQMTLDEKIGQMFMLDVRNWNGVAQIVLDPECAQMIKNYYIGGICLFAPNLSAPDQIATLTDAMQHAAIDDSRFKIPLFLATDQEGGYIVRLTSCGTIMPGNMAVGATASKEMAYDNGRVIGEELSALGINVDFAPVLDVNVNPDNPVIGVRSFGSDPQLVSDMGIGYIQGLHSANVGATVKHFPGHGDTGTDSHIALPIVNKTADELYACDLKPFRDAMEQGVDMVMTAHVEVPGLDDTKITAPKTGNEIYTPATLSKKILTNLIRGEFGFEGVVVTDALNMQALTDNFYTADIVIRAINAGADILLMPVTTQSTDNIANLQSLINDIKQAVNSGDILISRIDEAVTRILKVKMDRNIYDPEAIVQPAISQSLEERKAYASTVLRSTEHLSVEKNISDHAITLAKNDGGMLPFELKAGDSILIMSPANYNRNTTITNSVYAILDEKGLTGQVSISTIAYATGSNSVPTQDDKAKIDSATHIILGSMIYDAASRKLTSGYANYPNEAIKYANAKNKKIVNISLGLPYELSYNTDVKALVNTYCRSNNANVQNYNSAIRVIFGLVNPTGKYPVDVPNPNPDSPVQFIREVGDGLIYPATYKEACDLLDTAETTKNANDIKAAADFIDMLPNCPEKPDLFARLNTITTPKNIEKIEPITVITKAGQAPSLPTVVTAVYSDNTSVELPVEWDEIDSSKYQEPGTFTVEGKVEGTALKAIAQVTVTGETGEKPMDIIADGQLDRKTGIKAAVKVKPTGFSTHDGTEVVLFQLMKNKTPISIAAVERDITSQETFTAYFSVSDPDDISYNVKVFVFDSFDSDPGNALINLAEPVTLK